MVYDILNPRPRRKSFKTSTTKRVWMKARGSDPDKWRSAFIKTSYCMAPRCKKKLLWEVKTYDFDHKDNNNSRNSEKNCFLVCLDCHRKHTKYGTRRNSAIFGGIYRIKKKVGYKKPKKKKTTKKKVRKKDIYPFEW